MLVLYPSFDVLKQDKAMEKSKDYRDVPTWSSCRYRLVFVAFYCFFVVYMARFNLSVGIVCMVQPDNVTTMVNNSTSAECQADNEQSTNKTIVTGTFLWDKRLRANILSSFFYGYMLTQIPGGILSHRFGSKIIMMTSLCVSCICTVLVPVAASYRPDSVGPYLLIVLRFILGMAQGVCFPAMHGLMGRWAPKYERTRLAVFTYSGCPVGVVVTMPMSGVLCVDGFAGGWPSIFYVTAMFNVVAILLWWLFVYDSPSIHPGITLGERQFISDSIGDKVQTRVKVPWKSIFTSVPLYAIIITHFCAGWGAYTILVNVPMYMNEVLKFDIKANGFLSSLPSIAFCVVGFLAAVGVDFLRQKTKLKNGFLRKAFQCVGFTIAPCFVIGTGFVTCETRFVAVICLTVGFMFASLSRAGYLVNHVDLAPRYASILFGITNTIANTSGVLAPLAAGYLTPHGTRAEWQTLFYLMAAIYVTGAIVFGVFASGDKQEWASDDKVLNEISLNHKDEEGVTSKLM